MAQATISYLDLDKHGEQRMESLALSREDMRQAVHLLKDSYQRIMAHDFYTGCGEPQCEWCRFVQEDMPPPAHTLEDIEELDDN